MQSYEFVADYEKIVVTSPLENIIITVMKKLFIMAVAVLTTLAAGCGNTGGKTELKTVGDSLSYYMGKVDGVNMAESIAKQSGGKASKVEFLKGFEEALKVDSASEKAFSEKITELYNKMKASAEGEEQDKLQSTLSGMIAGSQFCNIYGDQFEKEFNVSIDKTIFLDAFKTTFLPDEKPDITEEKKIYDSFVDRFNKQYAARAAERNAQAKKTADDNLKAGQEFIKKEMEADKSIKMTESGLAYKVLQKGKGDKLKASQTAQVKYEGRHIDGSVFDNGGGRVAEFSPSQVVKGFGEGLMLMNPGAKYRLYIPGNLGYGETGTPGGPIGPNETLIFDVELVGIK